MKRTTRNVGFLFAGEIAARLLGFVVSALLARRLGITGFGQVGFAMSIMAYGIMITKSGLLAIGIREVARNHQRVREMTGAVLTLRLLLNGVALAGVIIFALAIPKPISVKLLLVAFAGGVIAQSLLLEWVFIGLERMHFVAAARVLTNIVYSVLILLLVRGAGDILFVPVAFVSATLVGAVVLLFPYVRTFGFPIPVLHKPVLNKLVRQAWPVGVASILTQAYVNSGIVGLALLRSDQETGLYTSVHRLVFFLLMVDRVFQSVFFPVISRYMRGSRERVPALTEIVLRIILSVSLPVCIGTLLLAEPALSLLFGSQYAAAAPALRALVWFFPLSLLSSLAGYTLLATDRQLRYARNTAIGVGVAGMCMVSGVLLWGATGAAVAMTVGEACLMLLMAHDFPRVARPRIDWRMVVPVLSCIPLAVLILMLRDWNWIVAAGAGAAGYLVTLYMARGLRPHDLGLVSGNDTPSAS
jgi:O-antigen/teichoic acid export membrane protein